MSVDTARLRELLEKATPGPVEAICLGSEGYATVPHPDGTIGRRKYIARYAYRSWEENKANAILDEALRNQAPALLDRLEALEAVAEAARDIPRLQGRVELHSAREALAAALARLDAKAGT